MRQSLQQKFNALTAVLLLFFLLMLPLFAQVKADTRDSVKKWRDTLSYKVWKDIKTSWIDKDKINNLDVEEVDPDEWSKQAKAADPNCDAACQPDGDRDGDNVTNAEELKNSKDPNCSDHCNPSCNEDKYGVEYCKQQSQVTPPVDPPKNATRRVVNLLKDSWFNVSAPSNCQQLRGTCSTTIQINVNYTEIVFYFNVTEWQGVDWSLQTSHNQGAGSPWTAQPRGDFGAPPNSQFTGIESEPLQGIYTLTLSYTGANTGRWHLQVYGALDVPVT